MSEPSQLTTMLSEPSDDGLGPFLSSPAELAHASFTQTTPVSEHAQTTEKVECLRMTVGNENLLCIRGLSTDQAEEFPPAPLGEWIEQLPENCELLLSHRRWQGKLKGDDIRACREDYANHLYLLDEQLQRLLGALAKREDAANTAVVVTADHGEMLGDHNMLYKGTFLEASIRVPFLYTPPPHLNNSPEILQRPVGLTNMFTTILKNLIDRGCSKKIIQTAKKTKHVCVEFGDELLTIQNNRKLCRKLSGEVLWATQLRNDPTEQINQLAENPQLLHKKESWMKLSEISEKELQKL